MIDHFGRDVRLGLRMLRRQPGSAIVIVLTLALGIGANTTLFSIVDAVLLRRLPVANPDRLVLFSGEFVGGTRSSNTPPTGVWNLFSTETYEFLRAERSPFESIAAVAGNGNDTVAAHVLSAAVSAATDTGTRATAHLVSGNYFDVMGAKTALGRTLAPADDRPEAAPVAVVSDAFWRRALHADANAVGTILKLNQTAFTVVGVMPPSFFGEIVRASPDVWVPLARQPDVQLRESMLVRPDYYWLSLIGRLAPGQSRQAAESSVTAALRGFLTARAGPSAGSSVRDEIASVRVAMVSGARGISLVRDQNATLLMLLLGAVGLVLLIACANVATLLLCRAGARQTEDAVRRALGASRARLVRQWLTETILLVLMGAGCGLLLARWAAPTLESFFATGPNRATLSGPVLVFTTAITALVSVVCGLVPGLRAGRADGLATLRSTGRGSHSRRRALGATEPFVIAQIAISLVLVIGATLFARSLINLEREPLGFDQDGVLLVQIDARVAGYTPATVGALYRRIHDQVVALPGVESATFARYSPFGGVSSSSKAMVDGAAPAPGQPDRLEAVQVGPNYPQTLGMPLLMGRAIGLADGPGAKPVAMVNEAFVRRFFPASNPLGHRVRFNEDYEIVGVVKDALFHSAREQMIPFVFVPMLQDGSQRSLICEIELRTRGDANGLAPAVRQAVARTDSRVAVTRVRTLRAQVLATFGPERLAAGFVGTFACLAVLLAAVGLYGVVAQSVGRRTREIGIRLALGAAAGDIVWLIVRETFTWLVIGTAIGTTVSAVAGRLLANRLFGVTAGDPASFLLASTMLAAIALAASLIPAVRALRIHPTVALRAE